MVLGKVISSINELPISGTGAAVLVFGGGCENKMDRNDEKNFIKTRFCIQNTMSGGNVFTFNSYYLDELSKQLLSSSSSATTTAAASAIAIQDVRSTISNKKGFSMTKFQSLQSLIVNASNVVTDANHYKEVEAIVSLCGKTLQSLHLISMDAIEPETNNEKLFLSLLSTLSHQQQQLQQSKLGLCSLEINSIKLTHPVLVSLCDCISKCSLLKELRLQNSGALSIPDVLADCIKGMNMLEVLDLSVNKPSHDTSGAKVFRCMKTICTKGMLGNKTKLKVLKLENTGCDRDDAIALSDVMESLSSLEEIDLSDNKIGDDGMIRICKAIVKSGNDKLKYVHFSHCGFTIKSIDSLCDVISKLDLVELNIGYNKIGNKGLQQLCSDGLLRCDKMRKLILCEIGCSIISYLQEPIKSMKYLADLDLRYNSIADLQFHPITKILVSNDLFQIAEQQPLRKYDHALSAPWVEDSKSGYSSMSLVEPPRFIIDSDTTDIQSFFHEANRGFDALYRSKIILFGEVFSGKSSIVSSLVSGNKPRPADKITLTIDVNSWDFDIQANEHIKKNRATLYDIGGAISHYAVRMLNFSTEFVPVLVCNLAEYRTEDERSYAELIETWVKDIQMLAPGSRIVIVATHRDKLWKRTDQIKRCDDILQKLQITDAREVEQLKKMHARLEIDCPEGSEVNFIMAEVKRNLEKRPAFPKEIECVSSAKNSFFGGRGLESLHDSISSRQKEVCKQIPLTFGALERLLSNHCEQINAKGGHVPALTMDYINSLAVDGCGIESIDVEPAIKILHETGNVLFFPNDIPDLVFPEPKLVYSAMCELMRHDLFERSHSTKKSHFEKICMRAGYDMAAMHEASLTLSTMGLMSLNLVQQMRYWREILAEGRHIFDAYLEILEIFELGMLVTFRNEPHVFLPFYVESLQYQQSKVTAATTIHDALKPISLPHGTPRAYWRYYFPVQSPPEMFEYLSFHFMAIEDRNSRNLDDSETTTHIISRRDVRKVLSLDSKEGSMISIVAILTDSSIDLRVYVVGESPRSSIDSSSIASSSATSITDLEQQQSNAIEERVWKEMRKHATVIEKYISKHPGIIVERFAICEPRNEIYRMDQCIRARETGQTTITVNNGAKGLMPQRATLVAGVSGYSMGGNSTNSGSAGSVKTTLNELIGPPAFESVIPWSNKHWKPLPQSQLLQYHLCVVHLTTNENKSHREKLVDELENNGLIVRYNRCLTNSSSSMSIIEDSVRLSACVLIFLEKDVFLDPYVQCSILSSIQCRKQILVCDPFAISYEENTKINIGKETDEISPEGMRKVIETLPKYSKMLTSTEQIVECVGAITMNDTKLMDELNLKRPNAGDTIIDTWDSLYNFSGILIR